MIWCAMCDSAVAFITMPCHNFPHVKNRHLLYTTFFFSLFTLSRVSWTDITLMRSCAWICMNFGLIEIAIYSIHVRTNPWALTILKAQFVWVCIELTVALLDIIKSDTKNVYLCSGVCLCTHVCVCLLKKHIQQLICAYRPWCIVWLSANRTEPTTNTDTIYDDPKNVGVGASLRLYTPYTICHVAFFVATKGECAWHSLPDTVGYHRHSFGISFCVINTSNRK